MSGRTEEEEARRDGAGKDVAGLGETAGKDVARPDEAAGTAGGDVIDEAVATARAARVKGSRTAFKVIAPAKVNLHLGVGPAGANGFHEVETVLHALALHDVLYVQRTAAEPGSGLTVELTCTFHEGLPSFEIAQEDNLAYRAVVALARALGREGDERLAMLLEKRIPVQAGLGGGSSNAAAALVGAAFAWGVPADDPRIEETARSLGADVAFFLHGGCGLYRGRGDVLARSLRPSKRSVVLVKPDVGVSTARAYTAFDASPQYVGEEERAALAAAQDASAVVLRNNLAPAAESLVPELAEVRAWLEGRPGVEAALLSGSGSATFAVCESLDAAFATAAEAAKRGWWSRATALSSARAAVVPR